MSNEKDKYIAYCVGIISAYIISLVLQIESLGSNVKEDKKISAEIIAKLASSIFGNDKEKFEMIKDFTDIALSEVFGSKIKIYNDDKIARS